MNLIFTDDGQASEDITKQYVISESIYPDTKTELELFGVHIRQVKGSWVYPEHHHTIYEINWVLNGHQIFTIEGRQHQQFTGDLILVRPGELHTSRGGNTEPFTYLCIHFNIDDKLFLPYLTHVDPLFFKADSSLARRMAPFLERIATLLKHPKFGLVEKMNMQALMFEMLGMLVIGLDEQEGRPLSERTVELAYQIAEQIERNLERSGQLQNSKIEKIATELNISVSYCNQLFKKVYHMSPRRYWSFKKLNKAKALLLQKNMTIEAVADELGYYDLSHFSRQFKRWTGLTPSQFRNNHTTRIDGRTKAAKR
ncbi:AraC family transcriptional regulator [Desmospora activa]|uniref:AraC family transcriptional regulator n=1 Tax=Desmospora activa TaxID=500615 RepID=UPI001FE28D02|nr:AraC family transcriptional regulator [Desmospora activa]